MVVEDREVHLHVLQLSLIIRRFDVVLGDVQRQAQLGNLIQLALDLLSGPDLWGIQAVRLKAQCIDITGVHGRANHLDDGIGIPSHEVIVVVDQNGIRTVLTCQTEGLGDPVASKRIGRIVRRSMRRQSFVHYVDYRGIRIACAVIANPLFNFLALLGRTQATNPAWLLTAPYQRMRFDRNTVRTSIVIDGIQRTSVVLVARAFYRAPLTFVFRRNLIPVLAKIRTNRTAGSDVTYEELGEIRIARVWVNAAVGARSAAGAGRRVAAIERIAKTDGTAAVQHLRERTRTTFSVPGAGVIFLIFGLIGRPVYHDVIHFDIAVAFIIGKRNAQLTGSVGLYGVVEHTDAQCPGLDNLTTDFQAHAFISGHAAHAHGDAVAAAGNRTAGAV